MSKIKLRDNDYINCFTHLVFFFLNFGFHLHLSRVQSAQQHLQALHAQYSHMANGNVANFMEGHGEEPGMMEMPVQEPPAAPQQPGAPQKGTLRMILPVRTRSVFL